MLDLPLVVGAFVAGFLMFLAPCTLPIVPGYLAFIAGVPAGQAGSQGSRRRIFTNALAFVLGFSVIFILLGTFAAALGSLVGPWRLYASQFAGVIIILFGVTMLGAFNIPLLSGERRMRLPKWLSLGHPHSSFVVGALFALGWSPCIGPILGTILFFASASATAFSGALLLAIFSLGLAIPFLMCAWAIGYAESFARQAGRLSQLLSLVGGIVLIFLGLLMLTGNMSLLVLWGNALLGGLGYERLLNYL
jgi:cytochrome c-type biogenesis protein